MTSIDSYIFCTLSMTLSHVVFATLVIMQGLVSTVNWGLTIKQKYTVVVKHVQRSIT